MRRKTNSKRFLPGMGRKNKNDERDQRKRGGDGNCVEMRSGDVLVNRQRKGNESNGEGRGFKFDLPESHATDESERGDEMMQG